MNKVISYEGKNIVIFWGNESEEKFMNEMQSVIEPLNPWDLIIIWGSEPNIRRAISHMCEGGLGLVHIRDHSNIAVAVRLPFRDVPWLTLGARYFLSGYVKSNPQAKILEFGCGGSTVWFAENKMDIISVETNSNWFNKVQSKLKERNLTADIRLFNTVDDAYDFIKSLNDNVFDFVLMDGAEPRQVFSKYSIDKLKDGGIFMLDNAERLNYNQIFEMLEGHQYFECVSSCSDEFEFYESGWKTSWWIK